MEPRNKLKQGPTVSANGKATVSVGQGDCAGDPAEVGEHGMPGHGWMEELGKPMGFSGDE